MWAAREAMGHILGLALVWSSLGNKSNRGKIDEAVNYASRKRIGGWNERNGWRLKTWKTPIKEVYYNLVMTEAMKTNGIKKI
jgi:hypothetical protein